MGLWQLLLPRAWYSSGAHELPIRKPVPQWTGHICYGRDCRSRGAKAGTCLGVVRASSMPYAMEVDAWKVNGSTNQPHMRSRTSDMPHFGLRPRSPAWRRPTIRSRSRTRAQTSLDSCPIPRDSGSEVTPKMGLPVYSIYI